MRCFQFFSLYALDAVIASQQRRRHSICIRPWRLLCIRRPGQGSHLNVNKRQRERERKTSSRNDFCSHYTHTHSKSNKNWNWTMKKNHKSQFVSQTNVQLTKWTYSICWTQFFFCFTIPVPSYDLNFAASINIALLLSSQSLVTMDLV